MTVTVAGNRVRRIDLLAAEMIAGGPPGFGLQVGMFLPVGLKVRLHDHGPFTESVFALAGLQHPF